MVVVAAAVAPMQAVDAAAALRVVAPTAAVMVVPATEAALEATSGVVPEHLTLASPARTRAIRKAGSHAALSRLVRRVIYNAMPSPGSIPAWKPRTATAVSRAVILTTSNPPAMRRPASPHPGNPLATATISVAPAQAVEAVVDAATVVAAAHVARAAIDPNAKAAQLWRPSCYTLNSCRGR